MSHYSDDSRSVRVDFFKPSGKWYTTEAVSWDAPYDGQCLDAFKIALARHLKKHEGPLSTGACRYCGERGVNATQHCASAPSRHAGMTAVCLDPCHECAVPLLVRIPGGEP